MIIYFNLKFQKLSTLRESKIEADVTGAYGATASFDVEISKQTKNDFIKEIIPSENKNIYFDSYNRWKEQLSLILN